MGLYSAAQARASTANTDAPSQVATPYYSKNAYIPSESDVPKVAPVSTTLSSPPEKTKTGFGLMFSKKAPQLPTVTLSGPPSGATSGAGNSRDWFDAIHQRLLSTVESNKLQGFYRPEEVHAIALRVWNSVNIDNLAKRWRMQKELALDLVALALYDIVLFGDDSGSMRSEGGGRIQDLTYIVTKVTEIAVLFDDDGISVRFINSPASLDNCKSESQITFLFSKVEYKYGTQLGTRLASRILEPMVTTPAYAGKLKKPVLIITITDGEPTQEPQDTIIKTIVGLKRPLSRTKYGGGAAAFQFSQVGTDLTAQAFLKMLDDHSEVGDLVDCTSAFELEQEECLRKGVELTPEVWLVKLMCGAIDPHYDAQD
ncbi:hypothetical protein BJ742DRAFT_164320 [Cladochytrium replicatum]|nr:hypothetical protein BJ742DRAFT_164320 [Cladochytrium replicatum]